MHGHCIILCSETGLVASIILISYNSLWKNIVLKLNEDLLVSLAYF